MLNFLNKDTLFNWMQEILMPNSATLKFYEVAKKILNYEVLLNEYEKYSNELSSFLCDWTNYGANPEFNNKCEEILGEDISILYLLAYLSALPTVKKKYIKQNIPLEIFTKTMSDISTWVKNFKTYYKHYGLSNFFWISNHLSFNIFYIGRLQYIHKKYNGEGIVLRNKSTNEFVMVCPKDFKLRPDGYSSGAGNDNEEIVITTDYIEDDYSITATPVCHDGYALKKAVTYNKSEYEVYMQKDDYFLEIHIPREGNFEPVTIKDSIVKAFDFYKKYFPTAKYKAVGTHTWLFSAQLPDLCPAGSNIVSFQKQFYRFPCKGSKGFLWSFVFGPHITEENAREYATTKLQTNVLDWLDEGKEIFDMTGYWFLDFNQGFKS